MSMHIAEPVSYSIVCAGESTVIFSAPAALNIEEIDVFCSIPGIEGRPSGTAIV